MADITRTRNSSGDRDVATWGTLTSSNAAGSIYEPEGTRAAVASVQFVGTFDSATAVLQGSNDGSTWVTLKDLIGSDISLTAAGAAEFSASMLYIRPSTSGGGGSQDIDCIVVARG